MTGIIGLVSDLGFFPRGNRTSRVFYLISGRINIAYVFRLGGPGNDISLRGYQRHAGHPFDSDSKAMESFRLDSPHGLDLTHVNVCSMYGSTDLRFLLSWCACFCTDVIYWWLC